MIAGGRYQKSEILLSKKDGSQTRFWIVSFSAILPYERSPVARRVPGGAVTPAGKTTAAARPAATSGTTKLRRMNEGSFKENIHITCKIEYDLQEVRLSVFS